MAYRGITMRPNDNATFLIAEDDPTHTTLLKLAFARAGPDHISLVFVPDGRQAADYIAGIDRYADRSKFPVPGLLLLDLTMPEFGGFELLHWLNARPELVRFPVIVFTSSDSSEDHQVAMTFKFVTGYLLKSPAFEHIPGLLMHFRAAWQNR